MMKQASVTGRAMAGNRRYIIVYAALVCLGAGVVGVYAIAPKRNPSLSSQTYEFGTARAGQQIRHVFCVVNDSHDVLHVAGIKSDCGCTVVSEIPRTVAAGERFPLAVLVRLAGESSLFRTRVIVSTTEGKQTIFTVQGRVVEQMPQVCNLGTLKNGQVGERIFTLRNIMGRPMSVRGVQYDADLFDVAYSQATADGSWRFHVKSKPQEQTGPFGSELRIVTDDDVDPVKTVNLSGTYRDWVQIEPAIVSFGLVETGQSPSASATVTATVPNETVRLISVEPSEGVHVKIGDRSDNGVRLDVTFEGDFRDHLVWKGSLKLTVLVSGNTIVRNVELLAMRSGTGRRRAQL